MRKISALYLALLMILTASCQSPTDDPGSAYATEQAERFNVLMETAVFETSAAKELTARVPTATNTPEPPTLTPLPSSTSSPEPTTVRNPWLFQDECEPFNNAICVKYSVSSESEEYKSPPPDVQVKLTNTATGESATFVIGSGSTGTIILVGGTYQAVYTGKCEGKWVSVTKTWAITNKTDKFGCKGDDLKYLGVKVNPY